jgi:hypothetical protein
MERSARFQTTCAAAAGLAVELPPAAKSLRSTPRYAIFPEVSPSLAIIIPYFGCWPAWIEFFIETCKWNPGIRWLLYTDCGMPENRADNVRIRHISFADYKALARRRVGITADPDLPYKLCDLRPALGQIHADDIAGFDFFGYGDLDVFYGHIRGLYTDALLNAHDVISTHVDIVSGHFAVLRNTDKLRRAYELIPAFDHWMQKPEYFRVDDREFRRLFEPGGALAGLRTCFVERYTTILSPRGWHDGTMNYPLRWFWKKGRLTNAADGERNFLYLHVMRWQSLRHAGASLTPTEGAWTRLDQIVKLDWRRARQDGFCISPDGITVFG